MKVKKLILSLPQYNYKMRIASLAVFCGSKEGKDPLYVQHAVEMGVILAQQKVKLIYVGGSAGMM